VLVVDDDPVTLRFFEEAITRCGCRVATASDANAARAADAPAAFNLALIDQRMPGGSGLAVLTELRASGMTAQAIATSADFDDVSPAELVAAGFVDRLLKPSALAEIAALLARHLGNPVRDPPAETPQPDIPGDAVLDDATALAALGGDRVALAALRALFRLELDALVRDCAGAATIDPAMLRDRLHRLAASCGFCGAIALRACAIGLERRLADHELDVKAQMREFFSVVRVTTERLAGKPDASGA